MKATLYTKFHLNTKLQHFFFYHHLPLLTWEEGELKIIITVQWIIHELGMTN